MPLLATAIISRLPDPDYALFHFVLLVAAVALGVHCARARRLPRPAQGPIIFAVAMSAWLATVPALALGWWISASWDEVLGLKQTLGVSSQMDAGVLLTAYGVCFLITLGAWTRAAARRGEPGLDPPAHHPHPTPTESSARLFVGSSAALTLSALVLRPLWRALDASVATGEAFARGDPVDPWGNAWVRFPEAVFSSGPDGTSDVSVSPTWGPTWSPSDDDVYLGFYPPQGGFTPVFEHHLFAELPGVLIAMAVLLTLTFLLARRLSLGSSTEAEVGRTIALGLPLLGATCAAASHLRLHELSYAFQPTLLGSLIIGATLALPALWALGAFRARRWREDQQSRFDPAAEFGTGGIDGCAQ